MRPRSWAVRGRPSQGSRCSDLRTVVGEFPELNSVAFGDGQIYFSISSDRTIYACGFPSCTEGPRAFVRGSFSGHLTTHREWVYWLDGAVRRKLRDGSSAAEALDLGAVLGPAVDGGTAPGAMGVLARSIAAQDGWLYALVQSSSDPDIACDRPGDACVIARWRDDALGNPRELVYKSATPIDYNRRPILVLDGELIFSAGPNGLTYSCDAANCPATLRPLGEGSTNAVTSDGNHLYWCTSGADGQGEIRRIARLRR